MELYTVTENINGFKTIDGLYIEKKKYSNKELKKFLQIAKHYYIFVETESNSTDFNDSYSDSWTNIYPCNKLNLVIKNDEVFGFVACGLDKLNDELIIVNFDKEHYHTYDGSCYSNISKDYYLKKYEFSDDVLNAAIKYKLKHEVTYYKVKDGQEIFDETFYNEIYFNAFDILILDNKTLVLKYKQLEFNLCDEKTFVQNVVEEEVLGVITYRKYQKYELVEI